MNLEPFKRRSFSEGGRHPTFILTAPGPAFTGVKDLNSHNITRISDPTKASEQHRRLVQTIRDASVDVITLHELHGHPNSVFTKDTAVCTPKGYLRVRMGLPSREGEEQWMAKSLDRVGVPCIGTIEAPGTVEGGDVILAKGIVFIGQSSRTNSAGVQQLSLLFSAMGYEIRTTTVPSPFLHLGGAMTLVSPDTILCVSGLFPGRMFKDFQRIEVPHTGFISGNVIPLVNQQVIADQSNQPAIKILQHQGFTVNPLDFSEFVKGAGGPSCLIMQIP